MDLSDPNSLRRARPAEIPFKLHAVISNSARTYIVMNKDLGSVNTLIEQLPSGVRPFALASLWAQMLTELHALHSAGYLHGDISAGNVFGTVTGQFKLMDFGRSRALAAMSGRTRRVRGTYIAPEVVRADLMQGAENMHWATEVFAAGVLLATVACKAWYKNDAKSQNIKDPCPKNLFVHSYRVHPEATMEESFEKRFYAMEHWLMDVTSARTGRISHGLILQGPQDNPFNQFFAPLATDHPHLCDMVLNDAMALRPQKRLPTDVLAGQARRLLPQDPTQRSECVAALQALEQRCDHHAFFWQACNYYQIQQSWALI